MSDFPPVGLKEDSAKFSVHTENPSHGEEMEGGYVYTRPSFTRKPRKTFITGFTYITQAQKGDFDDFWTAALGGSASFTYTDPTNATEYTVRFTLKMQPEYRYVGIGGNHRWDIDGVMLEEV